MHRFWYHMISERDQTPRSKNGYSTRRRSRIGGVWKSPIATQQLTRIIPQVSDKPIQPRKVWKGPTPDVLDAPDKKANLRPRCRTSVASERTHVLCDLRCNIPCVRVCSRSSWCYTRGHMTQYHTTAARCCMLRWDARLYNKQW
jgi:hypothetical protein